MIQRRLGLLSPLACLTINLLLAYLMYQIARLAYLAENWSYFAEGMTWRHGMEMWQGGLLFDTSAILYTNALYILLLLLPLPQKESPRFWSCCKWLYMAVNGVTLAMNLCDAVYFPFTMRRTTNTVFSEFSNEGNLGGIFLTETLHHWYLVLLFLLVMAAVWRLYRMPQVELRHHRQWHYVLLQTVALLLVVPLTIAGMRGGFTTAVRPITISNANQYANRPVEAALILNTPFSLLRTIGKAVFVVPDYYDSREEMAAVYSPVHTPNDTVPMTKKNVVVLIVESFGREYIGALNKSLEHGQYKGYTPFVDSLISRSVSFEWSFCNGRKSIDGMPSILSSIPMFVEPFFLTPSSMNQVSGIASLLSGEGYQTAFFHGAQRGSMGFQAFARSTGFHQYFGREDYNDDTRFGGDRDFDGMWAIWDEPFLQYYATKMSDMREPFMTAVFTASSHHPYRIPEQYKEVYPEEGIIMHKCIRYTDMALRKFFETASRQPWYKNTLFVLTSDHTNMSDHDYYQTDIGGFCSPIIIFDASGHLPARMEQKVAQQIDILPTLMGLLHYPKPYFAFGIDVLNTPAASTWAVNYLNGIYQYVKNNYVLQFDGQHTKAVYSLSDSLMQRNVIGKVPHQAEMEKELKAIIQQYMERMTQDRLQPQP